MNTTKMLTYSNENNKNGMFYAARLMFSDKLGQKKNKCGLGNGSESFR